MDEWSEVPSVVPIKWWRTIERIDKRSSPVIFKRVLGASYAVYPALFYHSSFSRSWQQSPSSFAAAISIVSSADCFLFMSWHLIFFFKSSFFLWDWIGLISCLDVSLQSTVGQRSLWLLRHLMIHFPTSSGVSEQANERMTAADCASEATSVVQANEWVMWANERTDEHVTQYSS